MDFFLMGILLWSLVIASLVLLVWGLWKQSWKALVWSGAALILPMALIFMGDQGIWFKFSVVPPLMIFAAAFYVRQRSVKSH